MIKIIAAVVNTTHLTLYTETGNTYSLAQGDPKIRIILNEIGNKLTINGYADIEESFLSNQDNDIYAKYQELCNNYVQFFKVAKTKLDEYIQVLDTYSPVAPQSFGDVPTAVIEGLIAPLATDAKTTQINAAIKEIMANAVSVQAPQYAEPSKEEAMIAVVEGQVIPSVQTLAAQFERANSEENSQGMDAFMKRISVVISQRSHSVQELLQFIEKGDLPIANDGSIIIYKILVKTQNRYADCHTRKVPQKIGSYVFMSPNLVDHNRRNECSNGLHVARKQYLANFTGDVCVLAKVAPEDVIAVPEKDANKMRVCGYHILFELPNEDFKLLKAGKSFSDSLISKQMLAKAIVGDHIGITQKVEITGQLGNGVIITEVTNDTSKNEITAFDDVSEPITHTEAQKVKSISAKEAMFISASPTKTRKEIAKELYEQNKLDELREYKKKIKCSWNDLGLPDLTPAKPKSHKEKIKELFERFTKAKGAEKSLIADEILTYKTTVKISWKDLRLTDKNVASLKAA